MRESIQEPLHTEMADDYGGPKRSGGSVFLLASYIPGVGILAAAGADIVADAGIAAVSKKINAEAKAKEIEYQKFSDVKAVQFRFDDGLEINVPVMVVSGMRYKIGTRLNAMVSPRYNNLALGINALFGAMPEVGDSDYNKYCRIDNAEFRKNVLDNAKNMVNEALIVNPAERRVTDSPAEINVDAVLSK